METTATLGIMCIGTPEKIRSFHSSPNKVSTDTGNRV